MLTYELFLWFFNGIFCDYDGAFGDQCFDLANAYSRWIGGQRFNGATADLIFNQPGDFYEAVKNGATNFPVKGDLVIWNWPHVGIATGNNTDSKHFEVLEQNDPENSNCHLKVYQNYNGVIGWLHPKQLPHDSQQALSQSNTDRDTNWNMVVALFGLLGVQLDPNDKSGSQQRGVDAINELKQQHTEDQNTIIGLKTNLATINNEDRDYAQKELDAEHERDTVVADRKKLYDALGVSSTNDALSAIVALQKPHEELVQNVQPTLEGLWVAATKKTRSPQVKSFLQKIADFFNFGKKK